MTEEQLRRWAFRRATQSMQSAPDRWAERTKRGLTDEQLREALHFELGTGGYMGPEGAYSYQGLTLKAGPTIRTERAVLQGERTVKYARDFYQIPNPDNPQGALL